MADYYAIVQDVGEALENLEMARSAGDAVEVGLLYIIN